MKIIVCAFVLMGLLMVPSPLLAKWPDHPLIEKAKKERMPRVQYALDNGVQVHLTHDGKSFYLLWFPGGTSSRNFPPMLVTMNGHDGWAFEDFYVWHQFLKERGYGFMAVQWWLGEGEGINDYLQPKEIYNVIDTTFRTMKVKPGMALLHGFSRGAANVYAVAAQDRSSTNNYFSLFIANAGKANSDYPPTREVEEGVFGEKPLTGSHWITYGGGKDPNPERDGITGMRAAGEWIKKYGGTVDLAIEDPQGGHGGFHLNPQNTDAALDLFDKQLRTLRENGKQ